MEGRRFLRLDRVAVYVHIPFCKQKCGYCDFYSVSSAADSLVDAVIRRILDDCRELSELLGAPECRTLYVGGGTPSSLGPERLRRLLSGLSAGFSGIDGGAEVTVEVNPRDLSTTFVEHMSLSAANRMSVGIQSFSPQLRRRIGRQGEGIDRSKRNALSAWNGRLSVDLIQCIPGQSVSDGLEDLRRALELGIDHLSVYALMLSPGAVAFDRLSRLAVDDEACASMLQATEHFLHDGGLHRYEVANYARPGCEAMHNRAYWLQRPFLGVGPGSVSTLPGPDGTPVRLEVPHDLAEYVEHGWRLAAVERLSPADMLLERLLLGLRTTEGIDLPAVEEELGVSIPVHSDPRLLRRIESGQLVQIGRRLCAGTDGFLVLDAIIADLAGAVDESAARFRLPWLDWSSLEKRTRACGGSPLR